LVQKRSEKWEVFEVFVLLKFSRAGISAMNEANPKSAKERPDREVLLGKPH
jgi:hypothetical protein